MKETDIVWDDNNVSGYNQEAGLPVASMGSNAQAANSLAYFLSDGHDSTRFVTDASGNPQTEYLYDAFGNLLNPLATGTYATDVQYTGQYFRSAGGGLYDLRARMYDPTAGRFTSLDTIHASAGDLNNANLYDYVASNPVNAIDPSGNVDWGAVGQLAVIGLGNLIDRLVKLVPVAVGVSLKYMLASAVGYIATYPLAALEANGAIPDLGFGKANEDFADIFQWSSAAWMFLSQLPQAPRAKFYSSYQTQDATEEEIQTYGKVCQSLRTKFNVPQRSTVTLLSGQVNNRPYAAATASGYNTPYQTANGMVPEPPNPRLGYPDWGPDGEQKLLEELFANTKPNDSGDLDLYINHPLGKGPCWNCNVIINQVAEWRPNIVLRVILGPNSTPPPAPPPANPGPSAH